MSARRTLMQWTVTRSTLVAWISMEHLKFTIRHGFVISGTRIVGRHFILTFHDITFRIHRPRLYDIDAQEKSDRGYPQYGGTVGLNQTLQSDAGALSPLVTPSGVEESLKTCHWKHQEMSGVRST